MPDRPWRHGTPAPAATAPRTAPQGRICHRTDRSARLRPARRRPAAAAAPRSHWTALTTEVPYCDVRVRLAPALGRRLKEAFWLGLMHRRMRSRGHQVRHAAAWIPTCYPCLADEHDVCAGAGQVDHVVWSAYAGLRYPDNVVRNQRRQSGEDCGIDLEGLQVASVDANDRGARVDCPSYLLSRVHLDQRGESDRTCPLNKRY